MGFTFECRCGCFVHISIILKPTSILPSSWTTIIIRRPFFPPTSKVQRFLCGKMLLLSSLQNAILIYPWLNRLRGTNDDLASFAAQLNWRGTTPFGNLSGIFPVTSSADLDGALFEFSASHLDKVINSPVIRCQNWSWLRWSGCYPFCSTWCLTRLFTTYCIRIRKVVQSHVTTGRVCREVTDNHGSPCLLFSDLINRSQCSYPRLPTSNIVPFFL